MSYFEFDDARRIHMPYEDAYHRGKQKLVDRLVNEFSELLEATKLQFTVAELETRHVLHVHKFVRGK